ncbi:radical SAM protein [Dehalococcoidia bacterium]|nr:radical SAM protein [Dehalococcoidia bacterium]
MQPSYLRLYTSSELDTRIAELYRILECCVLCPRECRKNRLKGEEGYCRSGEEIVVSAIHPHFGEEEPLVGRGRPWGVRGSGTIFLTGCNLGCVYCQNYDISHLGHGSRVSVEELSRGMMHLQDMGCHNINLVTPTHFVPQLVKSIRIAIERGLRLPIVYNCGGYEDASTIRLLEGIIDIYMPDMKYSDPQNARRYSNAADYFIRCREAVREMHRQVGDLQLDSRGIAQRGLLIRHLILPNGLAGSREILRFIAEEISKDSYVNIMFQYRPIFKAGEYEELNRRPTLDEYREAVAMAQDFGLHRGFGR